MKSKIKKIFTLMFFLVAALFCQSTFVQAASVKTVCKYATGKKTFYQDLTGDGKKEKITIKISQGNDGFINKIYIYVNNKKALTISNNQSYDVTIRYIYQSKDREFLQICTQWDYEDKNVVYQYNKKSQKLVKVLDMTSSLVNASDIVSVTSRELKICFFSQPWVTGNLKWNFTYVWKNGKFHLKSNNVSVKSAVAVLNDEYTKYFKKNQYVATAGLKFYTSTSLKKVAFTTRDREVVTLKRIKISGKKMYLQFKKGGKTGWLRVGYTNGGFYGLEGRLFG